MAVGICSLSHFLQYHRRYPTKFSGLGIDLAGINFSDLKHCRNTVEVPITHFI